MIELIAFVHSLVSSLLAVIQRLGYLGIFVGMAVESSVFPIPSELIMIPAGALISQGKMNIFSVFIFGLAGSIIGSIINYFIAFSLGRVTIEKLVSKYGKALFISKNELDKTDRYFKTHGEITTFIGRLLPGVRHLISLPAGFSKMNLLKFSIFTAIGAGFWSLILIYTGWLADRNQDWISQHPVFITVFVILISAAVIISYIFFMRKKRKSHVAGSMKG